jgi:hypothetical protein
MNPSSDIVAELNDWLARMSGEARQGTRSGAAPDEIELVRRAIAEIKALREKLGLRRATRTIAAEELNASNDE